MAICRHPISQAIQFISMTEKQQFARDVLHGLNQQPKTLPTRYIYDTRGSELFEQIMHLPSYYLTRTEYQIFEQYRAAMLQHAPKEHFNLVELGAGNGHKTKLLLDHLLQQDISFTYYPIDISQSAIDQLTDSLQKAYPKLDLQGLVMDYFEGLAWLHKKTHRPNFVLFLGSNIGNFPPIRQQHFLENLWYSVQTNDQVLIGFDLKKNYTIIQEAYADPEGITEAFTLNILHRINAVLGGHFDSTKFSFYATYNPALGANEAFIYSLEEQQVRIDGLNRSFQFHAFEPIQVEQSFKFNLSEIEAMARQTGFTVVDHYQDDHAYFVDSLWLCHKQE